MRNFIILLFCLISLFLEAQNGTNASLYAPSESHPFGQIHPEAPSQIADWEPMIGICDCRSLLRNPDGSWQDTTQMIWKFKYILNGMSVQDESWKDGLLSTSSIRQYNPDSSLWYVTFFSSNSAMAQPFTWAGGKTDNGDIVLYKDQTAPNGMKGKYKITFSDISYNGFNWEGAWVNNDESAVFPTWKIWCRKKS